MRFSKSVSYTSPRGSFGKRAVAEVTQGELNRSAQPSSNYRAVHVASRNCNGLPFCPQAVTQGRTASQEPRTHHASVRVLNRVSRCLPTTPFDTHQLLARQLTHLAAYITPQHQCCAVRSCKWAPGICCIENALSLCETHHITCSQLADRVADSSDPILSIHSRIELIFAGSIQGVYLAHAPVKVDF